MTDRKSLPADIAWLSVCVISVAAGHLIDDFMELTWFLVGSFGLISAVGLQAAARSLTAMVR